MYQKTTLANGLRIVTHDMRERQSASVGLWVAAGGRYEDDRIKGVAHFLEHMAFKGSQLYSCDQVKSLIEGVGGSVNAFTGEEQTCFYAKVPAQHLDQTFDVLADIVFHPTIAVQDVIKESTVIVEEIKMYHDLPQYYVMDLLDELMWPNHPLGKSLAGTPATVSHMAPEDLKGFHQQHYSAANIAIAAAGKVLHEELVSLAEKKLSKVPSGQKMEFVKADNSQGRPRVNLFRKDTEQMHLALGMLGLDYEHPDKYGLNLLNVILGGNMSSRLFDEVREKRGLAYSIGSGVKYLKDTGMFLVRAGVDSANLVAAVEVILAELHKIQKEGVLPDEFRRARDFYLGQVLMGLEDTMDHMLWIGESVLTRDRMKTLEEVVNKVNAVNIQDLQRIAQNILNPERFNFSLVGPIQDSQEQSLRKMFGVN